MSDYGWTAAQTCRQLEAYLKSRRAIVDPKVTQYMHTYDGFIPKFMFEYTYLESGENSRRLGYDFVSAREIVAMSKYLTYDPFDTNTTVVNFDDTVGVWDDTTPSDGIDTTTGWSGSVGNRKREQTKAVPASALDVCSYAQWTLAFSLSGEDKDYVNGHAQYSGSYERALAERQAKALKHWQRTSRAHHYCHKNNVLSLKWVGADAGFVCEPCQKEKAK